MELSIYLYLNTYIYVVCNKEYNNNNAYIIPPLLAHTGSDLLWAVYNIYIKHSLFGTFCLHRVYPILMTFYLVLTKI